MVEELEDSGRPWRRVSQFFRIIKVKEMQGSNSEAIKPGRFSC
jgi:hypothetical protein